MRQNIFMAIFMLLIGVSNCPGVEAENERAVPIESSGRKEAIDVLRTWHRLMNDSEEIRSQWTIRKEFRDAVACVDLDWELRLDEADPNWYQTRSSLLSRLAAHRRWEDAIAVCDRMPTSYGPLYVFWARVAHWGVTENDLQMIEMAGEQIERRAEFLPGLPGSLPRPIAELAGARFHVAASRLEVLRNQQVDPTETSNARKIDQAARDLWRTAGAFAPPRVRGSNRRAYTVWRDYASLEYWGFDDAIDDGGHDAADKGLEPLWDIVDDRIYWSEAVTLPQLHRRFVSPWVYRQVLRNRSDVALAYLVRAKGHELVRARLLAMVSRGLTQPEQSSTCREVASDLIKRWRPENDEETMMALEARSELAIAFHSAGDTDNAEKLVDAAILDFNALSSSNASHTHPIVLLACKLGMTRESLPEAVVAALDERSTLVGKHPDASKCFVGSIEYDVDLSKLLIDQPANFHIEHEEYFQLLKEQNWLAVVREAQLLAKGNAAWRLEYNRIGEQSVRQLGLRNTLEWTKSIKGDSIRMRVEMGAIREAFDDGRTLPRRNRGDCRSVAPAVPFNSKSC